MITFQKTFYAGASFLLLGGLLSVAPAQTADAGNTTASSKTGSKLSAADKKFVREAAEGGMAEVELGKLAADKATNQDVKQFGQRMVDDHSKANDQLKQVAQQEGITLPTTLSAKDKAEKERLSKLSGERFDQAYMSLMRKDHTKDVSEFRMESKSGHDPDVKSFAAQTLPTLQDHLKQAESIKPMQNSQRSAMQQPRSSQ